MKEQVILPVLPGDYHQGGISSPQLCEYNVTAHSQMCKYVLAHGCSGHVLLTFIEFLVILFYLYPSLLELKVEEHVVKKERQILLFLIRKGKNVS